MVYNFISLLLVYRTTRTKFQQTSSKSLRTVIEINLQYSWLEKIWENVIIKIENGQSIM